MGYGYGDRFAARWGYAAKGIEYGNLIRSVPSQIIDILIFVNFELSANVGFPMVWGRGM